MTWYEDYSSQVEKPEELDVTSSKVYNYIRKDIEQVEIIHDDGGKTKEWHYFELKIKKEDWDLFTKIMENSDEIAVIEDALCELSKE